MVLGKVVSCTTVKNMISTDLIDPDMKRWIDKYEANEAVHADGSNIPSDEAYGDIMM